MKQGLRTAGREAAMTARVHTADAAAGRLAGLGLSIVLTGGLASPGSPGDRGIVVEVSRP